MPNWAAVQEALDQGVENQVAPHVVLLAWDRGNQAALLFAGQARADTVFDLASLTKALFTSPVIALLEKRGLLSRHSTLEEIWGQAVPGDKRSITIAQLLSHSSGLPAHRPYFKALQGLPPSLARGLVKAMLMNEPLQYEPGSQALYSDLGYMILGLMVEEAAGSLAQALDTLYEALGVVQGPSFAPMHEPPPWPLPRVAPCGSLPGRPSIHGRVEDENAFALGGMAGHAGLFGSARQVAAVMDALCRNESFAWLYQPDDEAPCATRLPGFDTAQGQDSAAGDGHPGGVVGHLGFTGVSFWWQPHENSGLVLLTNRVAHGRDNNFMHGFRRRVHTLAWKALAAQ